ncbi:DNA-binding response regulator [Candidatus Parcubacteria bacterium]|nr:MAG: DNA-binding response regulator [Candidatus Parcubacteria bacterium]
MRVLVVEDEKEIRNYLKKSLEAECFVVDEAQDGDEAVKMVLSNHYDLITMDFSMPKMNGLDALKQIRKKKKHIPVLMLSVKSETTTKVDLLNAGADDYLTKPFSLDELMARSRALMRRPKDIKGEILKVADLKMDINKHIVSRGDEEIKLTRKEFTLLEYMMRNKGIALSRAMIMEHVWDMSADPFSNTIESHIMSLRKKVDLDGKKKLLYTLPGKGYKIDTKE